MGRPPGALRRRRYHPEEWELRDPRFEELQESDEDYGEGVALDADGYPYLARDPRARPAFISDELYFDGYDIGQHMGSSRGMHDQAQYGGFELNDRQYMDERNMAYRASEEALVRSASDRIARARAKGKTNANLPQEEVDALERRRAYSLEQQAQLASPPTTPAKPGKGKRSGRSNSSTSLAGQKTRKKGGSGLFGGNSSPSPAKSDSKAKANRKPSTEQAVPQPSGRPPPGVVILGGDGTPVYAPLGNFTPPSPEYVRASTSGSRSGSRSASMHSRRESPPPEVYPQYPPRYYAPPSSNMRPPSSGSNRSIPDDVEWYPPAPRNRSASSVGYPPYPPDYDPPSPQSRRNATSPADIRYATLRRMPQASPLVRPSGAQQTRYPDPAVGARKGSGLSQEVDGSESSSGGEGQGVRVDIVPASAAEGGYLINRVPVGGSGDTSGNQGKRKKGKK